MKNSTLAIVSAIVLGACQFTAAAAEKKYGPGVTDTEIKIGQTVPYSGPASAFSSYGRVMAGYFQMLNEKGGINSRKVNLISLDNAYSPPKALEQTRKLVEDDEVLADVGTVGTVPNISIQKYLNQNKVPHVFASAGGRRFNDPQNFPWTVPFYPAFQMEGAIFGKFILRNMPNAKIAVLYQNDDYGKDFLSGLKDVSGNDANAGGNAPPGDRRSSLDEAAPGNGRTSVWDDEMADGPSSLPAARITKSESGTGVGRAELQSQTGNQYPDSAGPAEGA
jgi:hypothetical protein